jgi:hypothetical protein
LDITRRAAFRLLGIPAGSDQEAVVHAYRRLARLTHPDVSTDPEAADRFATLTAAYQLASQPHTQGHTSAVESGLHPRASAQTREDLVDHWQAPRWVLPDESPMFVSSGAPAQWRQRRPIVAGPVMVTLHAPSLDSEVRDG